MKRWYVGYKKGNGYSFEKFQSENTPKQEDHPEYFAVIGPFKTKRGASFMEKYGKGNPHCYHVDNIERIAKHEAMIH